MSETRPSFLSKEDLSKTPRITQGTRVQFDTQRIDSHTKNMSIDVLWEKSYLCPCRDRATRQPSQVCKMCHGRGIAFRPAKPIDLAIQSQEKGISNTDIGLIESGTAIGTPARNIKIAFRDRITLTKVHVSQSYIFDVSQRRIDNGFYMVYDVNLIEFATTVKGELMEGTDYEFDFANNLFIPKQHLLEENVSLNISTTLRYMVADLLKEHRYARMNDGSFELLNQKLLLKREDIFIDKEAFELGTNDKQVAEMIDTKRPSSPNGLNGFFTGNGS